MLAAPPGTGNEHAVEHLKVEARTRLQECGRIGESATPRKRVQSANHDGWLLHTGNLITANATTTLPTAVTYGLFGFDVPMGKAITLADRGKRFSRIGPLERTRKRRGKRVHAARMIFGVLGVAVVSGSCL